MPNPEWSPQSIDVEDLIEEAQRAPFVEVSDETFDPEVLTQAVGGFFDEVLYDADGNPIYSGE